jgi:hypothetical protein
MWTWKAEKAMGSGFQAQFLSVMQPSLQGSKAVPVKVSALEYQQARDCKPSTDQRKRPDPIQQGNGVEILFHRLSEPSVN